MAESLPTDLTKATGRATARVTTADAKISSKAIREETARGNAFVRVCRLKECRTLRSLAAHLCNWSIKPDIDKVLTLIEINLK